MQGAKVFLDNDLHKNVLWSVILKQNVLYFKYSI
jgi:hypothetical protein